MRAFGLALTVYLPVAAKFTHREAMSGGDGESAEALAALAVEPHGRLVGRVSVAALARLERSIPASSSSATTERMPGSSAENQSGEAATSMTLPWFDARRPNPPAAPAPQHARPAP